MEAGIPMRVEALIVGCGPVGATLAVMLGRRGVSTLVIDKAEDIFLAPRAIAFDFDALRILQSIGVGEGDFDQVRIPFVRMISPLFGEFAKVNTSIDCDTHPVQITFYQPDLERTLRRKLSETKDVTLALQTELCTLSQTSDSVLASLKRADGETIEVRASYLIGADGASSTVRSLIGQDFQGKSFVEDWLIIDAKNPSSPIDHVEFLCDPKRPIPHMVAPGGRQRWEFMLAPGESRQQMESDAEIDRLLAPWGGMAAMEIERKAVYRFHARTAGSFRTGRVFLIGDAAHITPPFVGQGLVSGLRDASNLSWKLAYVLTGKAGGHILDSYDTERRPHSRAMINVARFMGKLIMPRNRLAALINHGTMKLIRNIPRLRGLLEEQGIRPANGYRRGCFLRSRRYVWPKPGYMLPQVWLIDNNGHEYRSDDILGDGFSLVGFHTDPNEHVNLEGRQILQSLDATIVSMDIASKSASSAFQFKIKGKSAFPQKRKPTVALVRPDRIVMAVCRPNKTTSMLKLAQRQMT
ncbi:bifunctional 3-(3-hydroxy-phenyl)propionate/3-hydroxycinnamic acid hydroxylase [Rhizobium paknamense]|uniref:3-(3-hydroxy-phenyl)propionate hydroxylase n=1 Tax=Rhizobium paknamense TaxID=1206817 RepID=A0ABU0IL47_9HYPH|nr:bifunctional 3-(3-hydroxy-phenyl)propionate/3-hydroxycinnamic acid hydroxylase [Rhizobium paknamense]MDQ0458318.1 3-(3-hydroxy-phenyl)propionate hydroxylase [Rhizobium paknamense]